jgi:hypothetical protein
MIYHVLRRLYSMDKQYDVVIVGGGTSGVIATIAAAREGVKALVVERWGHLGGTTVTGIPYLGIIDCNGRRINDGIGGELIDRMKKVHGCLGYVTGGVWADNTKQFSLTPFDPEVYKYVAQEMVLEAGADILFHSFLSDTIVENNTLKGVEVVNKSGKRKIGAKVVIDCTGDADVARFSGATMLEKNAKQNVSILFRMAGIDIPRFYQALKNSKSLSGWGEWHTRILEREKLNSTDKTPVHMAGHFVLKNRKPTTFTAISVYEGEMYINATRTINIDGADADDITKAEIAERRNVMDFKDALIAEVPGFEKAWLVSTAPLGVRESHNIKGVYVLQEEDVLGERVFEDAVARGAYPVDIHDPKGGKTIFMFMNNGGSYTIPYRCYIPVSLDGLLVAGRCLSATHEAVGTARMMGACQDHGAAVGIAAATAVKSGVLLRNVDVKLVQEQLRKTGTMI